jgi:hypothetical protein
MALATQADVENALGRFLEAEEDVTTLLEEASDLAAAYLGGYPDPVPQAVSRAVATMVVAVLLKPEATTADYQAGGYNASREPLTIRVGNESQTTTGPWLTKAIRIRLRPYRMRPAQRAYTINTRVPEDLNGGQEDKPQPRSQKGRTYQGSPQGRSQGSPRNCPVGGTCTGPFCQGFCPCC